MNIKVNELENYLLDIAKEVEGLMDSDFEDLETNIDKISYKLRNFQVEDFKK
jgi:hypothetical protein